MYIWGCAQWQISAYINCKSIHCFAKSPCNFTARLQNWLKAHSEFVTERWSLPSLCFITLIQSHSKPDLLIDLEENLFWRTMKQHCMTTFKVKYLYTKTCCVGRGREPRVSESPECEHEDGKTYDCFTTKTSFLAWKFSSATEVLFQLLAQFIPLTG